MNHTCLGHTLIDPNPIQLNFYPFMISIDKYKGSCNTVLDLSANVCVPSKTKEVNVNVFNIITKINEAKTNIEHISCVCKCKFNSAKFNLNQKWNNDICQCKSKRYCTLKEDYSWNPSTCIFDKSKYFKSIADDSVVECDEILSTTYILSKNVTITISTNVRSTVSINSEDETLMRFY